MMPLNWRAEFNLNVLIADAGGHNWSASAADALTRLPVSVAWSRNASNALDTAAGGGVHLGVVDMRLPEEGGLDFIRCLRGTGSKLPCMLVCEDPNPRLLREALGLNVFSVVPADTQGDAIADLILKMGRRFYPSA